MKTLFLKDGVVVGYGIAHVNGAIITSSFPGTTTAEVDDTSTVNVGWTFTMQDGAPVFTVPVPVPPVVSVIQYKMLFTSAERIATRKSTDPVIMDLQDLMNDPRTTDVNLALQSVSDALDYMTAIGLLAKGRKAEILTGEVK